jgi:di/tripeptidase
MRRDLLKRLLAVPTWTFREEQMVSFIADHANRRGVARCGRVRVDEHNNVYVVKGAAEFAPCLAAHIDSVHNWNKAQVVQQDGILFGVDEAGQRIGIGGDDKCGALVALTLLERFESISVAFFAAEEVGAVGAFKADPAFFERVAYLIEFDCPGWGLVSHSAGGEQLFANRGEFILTALPTLVKHGLTRWQRHPYTDVMAIRKRFDISCLNLSCGYYNWHRRDEFVVLDEVEAAINAGEALVRALGCRRYPFPVGAKDTAPSLIEVTGLNVPERRTYEPCC